VQRTYTPELGYAWTRVLEETIYNAQSKVDNLVEQERVLSQLKEEERRRLEAERLAERLEFGR
jgi:hypothetical protein